MKETTISEAVIHVLTPPGYERLTKRSETRTLRLVEGESIELILGRDHIIRLRRGNDGVVRISADGLSDEVKLPPNASVDIRRDPALADNGLDLKKAENYDESLGRRVVDYRINLPNRAVNLCSEEIDFTDIGDRPFSGLSIMIGVAGRRVGDNMIVITNHDGGFGIAAPGRQ